MPEQRSATDIATENHQPFNHLATVVRPFEAEGSRDVEFQQSTRTIPAVRNTTDHYYFRRDKQGFTRHPSRIPRLGSRQTRSRTRENCRVA